MGGRSGDNQGLFEEIKEQMCMHAVIGDCVGVIQFHFRVCPYFFSLESNVRVPVQ